MRITASRRSRNVALAATVASLAIFLSDPALAQTTTSATADAEVKADADTPGIVVIGTRRTDRSVTDSASPIDVIGATEIGAQPSADMLDTVRNLVPSFFVAQNSISDASTFVRPPSLRGLGADQILVMINGKRYNRAALVQVYTGADTALSFGSQGSDISNIPSISIKNLQILRDGATAQYGSDAIGGVINYQIRDDAGFEAQALYGQNYEGDGDRKQVAAYAGFKLGDRGFFSLSGEYYDQSGTSRGATRPIALELARTQPSVAARIPNFPNGPAQIWGTSPGDGYKAFANASFEVSDHSQLYGTVNIAETHANQSFNYRSPISAPVPLAVNNGTGTPAFASPGRNGSFSNIFLTPCPTGNSTCPAGGFVNDSNIFNFTSIYPGGFTPRFQGDVKQVYGTAGFKGKLDSGFTYDLSGTLAKNTLSLSMTQSLSASYGPQSQTSFKFGDLIQREQNANLDLTYPLEVGFASPVTLSGGVEYRREEYEKTSGDLQSYGAGPYATQPLYNLVTPAVGATPAVYAQAGTVVNGSFVQTVVTKSPAASGYGGTSPVFAGKNAQVSYGAYVGAEADITSALTMGIAGRWEHYDTFGSAVVGKANALFRVSEVLSLRATIGTGFHAPSPGQNNTQIVTTNFRSGNQVQTGTYPVTSSIAQFYGATQLQPERSRNYGAGFIIKPSSAFTITVDGYIIDVRNRIGISQTFTVTQANLNALPALSAVGVGGDVNFFTNGFNTRTKGIDAVASYRTRLIDGALNLTLAYAYNESEVTKFNPSVISADQRFNIANLPPRHRINSSANWQLGDFQMNARVNYYSSWANQLEYPGQRFGAKATADLDLSYTFMDHFTLTVGANNILDAHPDKIAPTTANPIYALTNSTADGQIYPRSGGPFGFNGGFYYARIRVKY